MCNENNKNSFNLPMDDSDSDVLSPEQELMGYVSESSPEHVVLVNRAAVAFITLQAIYKTYGFPDVLSCYLCFDIGDSLDDLFVKKRFYQEYNQERMLQVVEILNRMVSDIDGMDPKEIIGYAKGLDSAYYLLEVGKGGCEF